MKKYTQSQNISFLIFILLITIVFQGCIYEPNYKSVAIIENRTDSVIYITTPIDIIYVHDTSEIVFNTYVPQKEDIINIDTIGLKCTSKIYPRSNSVISEQQSSSRSLNMKFLFIKSPRQKICLTSNDDVIKAFSNVINDTCKLIIHK